MRCSPRRALWAPDRASPGAGVPWPHASPRRTLVRRGFSSYRRGLRMVYRILADAVVLVHAAFVAFVVLGGFLTWRWRWVVAARAVRPVGRRHRVRRLDLPAHATRERAARPRRARRVPRRIRRALCDSGAVSGGARPTYAGGARHPRPGGESGRLRHAVATEMT